MVTGMDMMRMKLTTGRWRKISQVLYMERPTRSGMRPIMDDFYVGIHSFRSHFSSYILYDAA